VEPFRRSEERLPRRNQGWFRRRSRRRRGKITGIRKGRAPFSQARPDNSIDGYICRCLYFAYQDAGSIPATSSDLGISPISKIQNQGVKLMLHFRPPKPGKLPSRKVITTAVVVVVALITLGTSVYIVNPAEQAVVTRFGRYIGTREPGLQFRLPFGIDRNYNVDVMGLRTQEFGFRTLRGGGGAPLHVRQGAESTMLTGDLNIIDVEWNIQYRVSDARAWVFNVNDRIATIRDVSRTVINQLVGDRAIMDVMGDERIAIQSEGLAMMNDIFRQYGLGINVTAVLLQNVTPPAGVQAAFDDVVMAMQDRERLINEGQQVFNEEIPRTRGEAERHVLVAQGYAIERVNRALGDVARFNAVLAEYTRAPEVTRQRLYFEVMEEVFRSMQGTTLVDHNLHNVLPLMNLGGQ